jgi:hypothetical protein
LGITYHVETAKEAKPGKVKSSRRGSRNSGKAASNANSGKVKIWTRPAAERDHHQTQQYRAFA